MLLKLINITSNLEIVQDYTFEEAIMACYYDQFSLKHKKNNLVFPSNLGRQCSPRGGDLAMVVRDNDIRVDLSGKAKVVLKGRLIV